jgi:hypothetical protein
MIAATTMSSSIHSLPWWADALFVLLALVILATIVWAIVEFVRWMTTAKVDDNEVTPADQVNQATPVNPATPVSTAGPVVGPVSPPAPS